MGDRSTAVETRLEREERDAISVAPQPAPAAPVPTPEVAVGTSTGVDATALRDLLLGEWRETRLAARDRMLDPVFHLRDDESVADQRSRVTATLHTLLETGAPRLPFPPEFGGRSDAGGNLAAFAEIVTADPSLQIKAGVQWGLFTAAILHLGTRTHHERFLADAIELRVLGGFAMTETGHGSDVASIATTATYDPAAEEFVISTPFRAAWKDYIGNAAVDAHAAVVFAQLETQGQRRGVHAFYVPIRDESGAFLPGVGGEDDGPKGGLNGVDNGRLHFSDVRIPRTDLLNRYGDVAADGTYSSPIASPGRRFFTMLGTLVQGRVSLALATNTGAQVALQIAVRYAAERRQFPGAGRDETVLLDYPRHQRRLLPRIATSYAASFALNELLTDFHAVFSGEHDTDEARQDLETFAAAMKAETTWFSLETIQECREACGGAGFLAENRFGRLHSDLDVYATFEGDNTVLLQLVGKRLLTDYGKRFTGAPPATVAGILAKQIVGGVAGLSGATAVGQRLADGASSTRASHALRDRAVQERLLTDRVEVAVAELAARLRPAGRATPEQAAELLGRNQHALVETARAFARLRQWQAFDRAVGDASGSTRLTLGQLRDVFALGLIEHDLDWYLVRGRLNRQRARAVPVTLDALLAALRPHAVALADAFGYEQGHLRAAIASGAEQQRQDEARAATGA
ncbi:acyl-CoA dehydrogenase family protein [Amnibacterium sp.]|uniref:acyl-CoA dehydrogenase family protein n=1 Tax=Amnibacterium sp. TaxID=1872496 RepID=UPI00262B2257|nr:acyl-CoA dehydrogenase family protein [Amnibacterium sp.]MCU1474796.1 acyl-CoA dehydrogenase [Amnibacterium sp.]